MDSSTPESNILDPTFNKLMAWLSLILTFIVIIFVFSSDIADPIPQTIILFGYAISMSSLLVLILSNPPLNVWLKFPNQTRYPYLLIIGSMLFYGSIFVIIGLFTGTIQPSNIAFIDKGVYFYTVLWIAIAINFFMSYLILVQEIPYYLNVLEHEGQRP